MQAMSEGMATLLKSGRMIGDNRPSHEIVLNGVGDSYDWLTTTVTKYPVTDISIHGSFEKSSDGSILYVYTRGTTVYQTNIADVETLLSQDDSIGTETAIFSNIVDARATLFKIDGILYLGLMFTKTTTETTTFTAKIQIYKSITGDGSDWLLYSTIKSIDYTWDYRNPSSRKNPFTIPIKFNGAWILPITEFRVLSGGCMGFSVIKISYDDGITWSDTFDYGSNQVYTLKWGKNISIYRNKLWLTGMNGAGTVGTIKLYNSIDGIIWNLVDDIGTTEGPVSPISEGNLLSDSNMLYWFINSENPSYVYGTSEEPTAWSDFTQIITLPFQNGYYSENKKIDGELVITITNSAGTYVDYTRVLGVDISKLTLQVKSIQISRTKGMAGQLTVEFDNKNGILAPDGTTNPALLWPNKEVVVKQGYGTELIQTFNGLIDNVSMSTFPQSISINARDKMKALLDHYVRDSSFNYVVKYENQTVEAIWQDLITKAGLTYDTVETTGITLTEKTFSWESYADAISWLDEIAGFETYCDEFGNMNFVYDGRPESVTVAYEFVEGVDIISLGYDINDKDLYYAVVVYGKDANDAVVYYAAQFPQAGYWNIPSGKIMRIDAPDADTQAKCQTIAEKAIYLMQTRARQVHFETIGIPHLQRGDFIQVTEASTTISEIYRITDISTSQEAGKYTMNLTCYYHAAPEV